MLSKLKNWFRLNITRRQGTYPRTIRTQQALSTPTACSAKPVSVPLVKGFELEGLGVLGQGSQSPKGQLTEQWEIENR